MAKDGLGETLWEAVEELMKARYGKVNVTKLGEEAKIGGTSSRIKARDTSVGLEILEKVARTFGIEPYQLLIPDKDLRQFLRNSDKDLRRIARIYAQTDDSGRQTINTAVQIAEQRARNAEQAPGVGKARKT